MYERGIARKVELESLIYKLKLLGMGVDDATHRVWRVRKGTRKMPIFKEQAGKEKPASDAENEQWKEKRKTKGVVSRKSRKTKFPEETISNAIERLSKTGWKVSSDLENYIICNFSEIISMECWE